MQLFSLYNQCAHSLQYFSQTFVIAHRLATLKHVDLIIVVGDGKVIEKGTHDELLALKGNYFNLWTSQNVSSLSSASVATSPTVEGNVASI